MKDRPINKDALNAAAQELNDLIDKGELPDRFGPVHGELFLEFYQRQLDRYGHRLSVA